MDSNIFGTPMVSGLRSPMRTPFQSSLRGGEPRDLEELIGSLGIDLFSPTRMDEFPRADMEKDTINKGINKPQELPNPSTLRYGMKVRLRGSLGKYLSANSSSLTDTNLDTTKPTTNKTSYTVDPSQTSDSTYLLGINGLGTGSMLECLAFIPIDLKDTMEPITYGTTLCIKAVGGLDRLLGIRDNTKLGFWRNLVGQHEKWTILKAVTTRGRRTYNEDITARGQYISLGDEILLQAGPLLTKEYTTGILAMSELLLILYEGIEGVQIKLNKKERISLSNEIWQIEGFYSQPNPLWTHRPYYNGEFLLTPSEKRMPPSSELSVYFPQAAYYSSISSINTIDIKSLSSNEQAILLMKDILYVMSGVEGVYIRIAAPTSSTQISQLDIHNMMTKPPTPISSSTASISTSLFHETGHSSLTLPSPYIISSTTTIPTSTHSSSGIDVHTITTTTTGPLKSVQEIQYIVNNDDFDISLIEQVSSLFPMCQQVLYIRDFIRHHSQYDYGLVSHAFTVELKKIIAEYDVLIVQLEQMLLENKLTLQKLIFFIQPTKTIICSMYDLCTTIQYMSGGELLNKLYSKVNEQGDSILREAYIKLFQYALKPYLLILENWLFRGELEDIYQEFMIYDNDTLSKDTLTHDFNAQYWESKYTLYSKHIPSFLLDLAVPILIGGKYLNVIRGIHSMDIRQLMISAEYKDDIPLNSEQADMTEIEVVTDENTTINNSIQKKDNRGIIIQSNLSSHDELDITDDSRHYNMSKPTVETYKKTNTSTHQISKGKNFDNKKDKSNKTKTNPLQQYLNTENHLSYDINQNNISLTSCIYHCYHYSSRTLLKVLEYQYGLSTHLRSLRRYFLLENGDFFIQFMDIAKEELSKDVKDIRLSRVQALLQLAVQTSTLSDEMHRDQLTCTLEPYNLIQQLHQIQSAGISAESQVHVRPLHQGLKGVESLVLNYQVEWPLSIILSRRAITKYQLLSRILFFSKYVEMRILDSWMNHQRMKGFHVRQAMGAYYCLRQRMLHFLQNFVYYMTLEVIKPRDHELQQELSTAQDMDEVLILHDKFLDTCLQECLLASQDVLNVLTKIMATCLLFADHVQQFISAFDTLEIPRTLSPMRPIRKPSGGGPSGGLGGGPRLSAGQQQNEEDEFQLQQASKKLRNIRLKKDLKCNIQSDYIIKETRQEIFIKYLHLFEEKFDNEVSEFLEKLWTDSTRSHPHLSNLCVRLDYNGYYSQKYMTDISISMTTY